MPLMGGNALIIMVKLGKFYPAPYRELNESCWLHSYYLLPNRFECAYLPQDLTSYVRWK